MPDLDSFLGKNIDQICGNGFVAPDINHCAHFVAHALNLDLGHTCRKQMGGHKPGAALRVQELFAECPEVGVWQVRANDKPVLAFVTAKANVNLGQKQMANVPKKHVGIFSGGRIFHYSNGTDKVVADTPEDFHRKFKTTYRDPNLGMWFGTLPGSGLGLVGLGVSAGVGGANNLAAAPTGSTLAAAGGAIAIEVRRDPANAKRWLGKADGGPEFLVGKEVPYEGRRGLVRLDNADPRYAAKDYESRFGPWAWLVEVTGHCESANRFAGLNTYDTAGFTFGFFQMAAHVGRDNLLAVLRAMLELPNCARYFPELQLRNGRLHKVDATGTTNLEATDAKGRFANLIAYLNPGAEMEMQEATQAARFIHWALNDPAFRDVQAETAHRKLYAKITGEADQKLNLDGQSDIICCIVFDILHQGRGKYTAMKAALAGRNPRKALLAINAGFTERAADLDAKIKRLEQQGKLGRRVYRRATQELVEV